MDDTIFEKFSDSARSILISSQKYANGMNQLIGSEHVLLAIISYEGTFAYEILRQYDVNLDQIKLVLSLSPSKPSLSKVAVAETQKNQKDQMSDEAQKLLVTAVKIASEHQHASVDAEHLLLAIVSHKKFAAHSVIERLGINPAHLKAEIESLFDEIAEVSRILTKESTSGKKTTKNKTKSKTPALDYFATDLTHKAIQNMLDPVIGREKEIGRVVQILCRRTKNNPILLGEPGVGKTAIVEGLAQRIVNGNVPITLLGKRLMALDLTSLVAGTMYRGQFEDRMKKVLEEITANPDIILFIDEIHTIIGAGSAEGSLDAANILKPTLAKGLVRLIGATTHDEYRKHIKKDSAFDRRLQSVIVEEPSNLETVLILKALRPHYEAHHQVTITDEALETAVSLATRYIPDRFMPDKAIDLIDEASAASQAKVGGKSAFGILTKKIARLNREKEAAVNTENYQLASQLKTKHEELTTELETLKSKEKEQVKPIIDGVAIAELVHQITGVPVHQLLEVEKQRYRKIATVLKNQIVGQDEAIEKISSALKRSRTGLADPNRPIGTFLFLGPTGVGKTELARVLAKEIFGNTKALIKVDMSDLMERHNTSRLVGAPAGYVGYEEGGKLTEMVRRQPYSVLLLDEIEKAHPEVFNLLLQVFEEGQLSDAKGAIANFRNTIIILTSNFGMADLTRQAQIGFQSDKPDEHQQAYLRLKNDILKKLKQQFSPEFLNRLDQTIVFQPLSKQSMAQIVNLELTKLKKRVSHLGYRLEVKPKAVARLAELGYSPEYGARALKRAIAEHIEGPLADYLLSNQPEPNEQLIVDFPNTDLVLAKGKPKKQRVKIKS